MKILQTLLALSVAAVFASNSQAATIYGLTTTGAIITFDSSTPGTTSAPTAITGLVGGDSVVGIDFRPATGGLYGLGAGSRLYLINPATGVATQVGSSGAFALNGTTFGFDFNPVPDRLRVTSDVDQNLRLNPNDGTLAATDTSLAYSAGDPNFGANPNIAGSAYTNNFAGAGSTTLYGIDASLDILVTQNPPNNGTLNTVGPLGFNTTSLVGFDIQTGTNTAYASLSSPTGGSSSLFTINLTTGAATLVGTIGGNSALADIALPVGPVPEPGTLGLLFLGGAALLFGKLRKA